MARTTIDKGIQELRNKDELKQPERLRKPGGGRKKAEDKDPTLINHLDAIMKESTAGDPMSLLRWTYKSNFRSWKGARIFCRIRGYISTVKKNSISVIDAIQGAFEGKPFVPARTQIAV